MILSLRKDGYKEQYCLRKILLIFTWNYFIYGIPERLYICGNNVTILYNRWSLNKCCRVVEVLVGFLGVLEDLLDLNRDLWLFYLDISGVLFQSALTSFCFSDFFIIIVVLFFVLFTYHWTEYTDMTVSSVTQRMGVHYGGSIDNLEAVLTHLSPDVVVTGGDKKTFRLFSAVDVIVDKAIVTLEVFSRRFTL